MPHSLTVIAQQQTPHFDSMYWIMLTSRIMHIVGAIILIGGIFYIRAVLPLPFREGPGEGSSAPADQFYGGRRAVWAKWIGIATALILISGIWNYIQIIQQNERMPGPYHAIAGIKILAAIAVFALAALLAGRTAAADAIRRNWRLWLNVCLVLGLITVIFGSVLRSLPHVRKLDSASPPQQIAPLEIPPLK